MLARLPIIVSLATLVAADFKIYWYSQSVSDPSSGAAAYGGIKFFNSPPDCNGFINEGKGFDIDFDGDVSDGQNGGYACDGCDENVNWNDWRPSRIEINDLRKQVFANEPYHITLYGNGDGTYTIRDTADNQDGTCSFVENRQVLDCGTAFGPYLGLEALNCVADYITLQ